MQKNELPYNVTKIIYEEKHDGSDISENQTTTIRKTRDDK